MIRLGTFRIAGHRKRWQERNANCPYHHMHDHEKKGLRPASAHVVGSCQQHVGDKRQNQNPSRYSPVATYFVRRIHHPHEHQNGAQAAKDRVQNRRGRCQGRKSGSWMNYANRNLSNRKDGISEHAIVNGANHSIRWGPTCLDSPIPVTPSSSFCT
jgi:hypothetical protein